MLTLTHEEIASLTGRVRSKSQREALTHIGIPYRIRPDGSPVVLRAVMEAAQRAHIDEERSPSTDHGDTADSAMAMFVRLFAGNDAGDFLMPDRVLKKSQQWERLCGIYFLIDGDEIVYVGQSTNIHSRIAQHSDKKFDRFTYVPCDPSELDVVETIFIHAHRPRLNFAKLTGRLMAPISWGGVRSAALSYHAAMDDGKRPEGLCEDEK